MDEKTLLLKKEESKQSAINHEDNTEKTAILRNNSTNEAKETNNKSDLNNTVILNKKENAYHKNTSIKSNVPNIENVNPKTIIQSDATPSAKKLFSRSELSNFTERVDYKTIVEKKKVTEEKTDVFIDVEDHLKDIDEVKVGYVIDDKYELIELITKKSGEAAIYKCYVKGLTGIYVAKVYYPNIQPKEDIMEKILSNLNSENVIKLNMIGFILTESGRRLYEIMPFYGSGTLESRMPICEEELIEKIIPSINEGLHAIHRINIIHRDLKPNNLFIETSGNDDSLKPGYKLRNNERIIIADFGISSQIKEGATHRVTSASRTRGYGAPETIRENITTLKSDYFAFGVTLLTLLNGEYPYHDEIEMILKTKDNIFEFPKNTSKRLQELIIGLLQYDRNMRFGYEEVKTWLLNKEVQKQESRIAYNIKSQTPYEYKFKQYYDLSTLLEAMIQDWNFSIQHIENRFIEKYFKGQSNDFDIIISDMERLRHVGAGNDKIFLMLIYQVLRPTGIIYHDLNFQTLSDMSDYILTSKEVDKRIIELLKNHVLGYIITLLSKYKNDIGDTNKLKNIIDKVEDKAKANPALGYYLLGYIFNKDKKNIDLVKNGIVGENIAPKITNLEDVYKAFKASESKENFSNELLENPRFNAWLFYMGYSQNKKFMQE